MKREKKDNRIQYSGQTIELEGNKVSFDGKGNPDTKTLKVYRYHGDITLRDQAMQDFALTNGYETVVIV